MHNSAMHLTDGLHKKAAIFLTLSSALLLCGCAGTMQKQVASHTTLPPQSTPVTRNYHCTSGETIAATYRSVDSATLQYKNAIHTLQIAISGSGARYVGGGLEWWTKGSGVGATGTLSRLRADGTSGEVIQNCEEY